VFTWITEPVSLMSQIIILLIPFASAPVILIVMLFSIIDPLAGVGNTRSNVGAVESTVNIRREVFTLPAVSVELTFT
jgi:hypothetical protein